MSLWVHAVVKNTDNDQFAHCFDVEDDIPANGIGAEAGIDIVPRRTETGRGSDQFKTVTQLTQIFPPLEYAPFTQRIFSDPLQVLLRRGGNTNLLRGPQ